MWLRINFKLEYPDILISNAVFLDFMERTLKLKHKWALWETYIQNEPVKSSHHQNYVENLNQLLEFDTLEDFALLWTYLPHGTPSKFFLEHGTRNFKKLQVSETSAKQVESVAFFKSGIIPAWEDKKNAIGGEYQIKMMDGYPEEIDALWKAVIFDLMGGDLGLDDRINGIRIVEKSKAPRNNVRIEVWVDFKDNALRQQLDDVLSKKYTSDRELGAKLNPRLEWRDH